MEQVEKQEKIVASGHIADFVQRVLRVGLNGSILAMFFFIAWWLRPDPFPEHPYYLGFLISVPLVLAPICWTLLGWPGLLEMIGSPRRWFVLPLLLLILWALWSPAWAAYPIPAREFSEQLTLVGLFTVILLCAAPSARWIVAALAMGLIFQGVITIVQVERQQPIGLKIFGEFELPADGKGENVVQAGTDRLMRPYGLSIHPNVIGGVLAISLLAISGWLTDRLKERWRNWVRVGVWMLGLWALLITFSRSAFLGFGIGIVVIALSWRRSHAVKPQRRSVLVALIAAVLVVGSFARSYGNFLLARTATSGETTELRSISDRFAYMRIAFQLIDQYPITGIGMANFPYASDDILRQQTALDLSGDHVHNVALSVLSELGIVGFLFWASIFVVGLWQAWRTIYDPFAVALVAGTVTLLVIGLFDHYPWTILHNALLLYGLLAAALCPHPQAGKSSHGDSVA